MSKAGKVVLITGSVFVALIIGAYLLIGAIWSGAFHFMLPEEVAAYDSPDGAYSLVFEQMGDPGWPFGPTDVRLTLRYRDGKIIERVSAQVFNDGGNASEHNIASVSWNEDAVVVVLRSWEAEDREISIEYRKN